MVELILDFSDLYRGIANMGQVNVWWPIILQRNMDRLGRDGVAAMREILAIRNYTGTLGGSVSHSYNSATKTLTIQPNARRRSFIAGDIHELGTNKITNIPWQPIRQWALAKGMTLKQAGAVWNKIRQSGVRAHPFIDRTVNSSRFQNALTFASSEIAREVAEEVVKKKSGVITP